MDKGISAIILLDSNIIGIREHRSKTILNLSDISILPEIFVVLSII